jgi:hypothetical protein
MWRFARRYGPRARIVTIRPEDRVPITVDEGTLRREMERKPYEIDTWFRKSGKNWGTY